MLIVTSGILDKNGLTEADYFFKISLKT